jgi:hypothetical protein
MWQRATWYFDTEASEEYTASIFTSSHPLDLSDRFPYNYPYILTVLISTTNGETACFSETLASTYKITRCHNPAVHNVEVTSGLESKSVWLRKGEVATKRRQKNKFEMNRGDLDNEFVNSVPHL